ncbi:hypothetical protein DCAR_0103884 [Daucus carota subsp. sativus]|uniref:Uncharacterized protein n=1 Tax=Daucus carota subsp. sativus TaxID=79200 RepID=A0AAF0WAZ3_DAUCS|nr:hypothetical protein DCAR_0103884 [Daucus carota subsp. sativus]
MNHELAQVYVTKKLYKDKMNKMQPATKNRDHREEAEEEKKMNYYLCCFSMVIKKIHPS